MLNHSAAIEAGGRAVYESLRCGPRQYVEWEDIPENHQHDLCVAFEVALAAYNNASDGMDAETYVRAARRSYEVAKRLSDATGLPLPPDVEWLATASALDILLARRGGRR